MAFNNLKGKRFTQITASAASSQKELYRKIPAVLRLGKKEKNQGGFFSYDRILSASDKNIGATFFDPEAIHVEQDNNELVIFLTASVFRDMMNEDFLSESFNSKSYPTISASFFNQIGTAVSNMPPAEAYVGVLASFFEAGSRGSGTDIIPPVTASVSIKEGPGLAFNAAGQLRKRKITYINSSSNFTNSHFYFNFRELDNSDEFGDTQQEALTIALVNAGKSHLTRSFRHFTNQASTDIFYYIQPKPIPEFSIEMSSSNSVRPTASFFALTSSFSSSADFGVVSGSFIGAIFESSSTQPRFYNGTNHNIGGDKTDGAWQFVVQKAVAEGEGERHFGEADYGTDGGTNQAFTPQLLSVWYPSEYTYANVRSSSFYFTPYPENMNVNNGVKTKNAVTSSISSSGEIGTGELRTLYWLNHTYTSSFTGSFGFFDRHSLKTQTGDAIHHQLPYMNTSIQYFGRKGRDTNASHLFKDSSLSRPADEGYYVHSSSFSIKSKNQMTASLDSGPGGLNNTNHSSSFFVMGVFRHKFTGLGGSTRNYTASQFNDTSVTSQTFMSAFPVASCMFLKRHDDKVFIYQASASGLILSESVGE